MIVLKILLILLLVILGLLALILFCPVTYALRGKSNGAVRFQVDLRWLLFVLFLKVTYDTEEKKPRVVLRIFGIPITLYPKKVRGEKRKKPPAAVPKEAPTKEPAESRSVATESPESSEDSRSASRSIAERIKAFFRRLRHIGDSASQVRTELLDAHNKDALKHILSEGKILLHHYRPRRVRTNLSFSAGDPAYTGELTGVLSLLPQIYARGNRLYPDFTAEKAYLDGTFRIAGHIVLFYAVAAFIRLLSDQNCRRLLKHIKAMRG